MIFVTVGTHEQPFDRLFREIDRLVEVRKIFDDVFCQVGYGEYEPAVPWTRLIPFGEMAERIETADVVVTHGGPGSVMPALAARTPVVLVPRRHDFGEHVDDHQVAFCRRVGEERGVPVVEDIADLSAAITTALVEDFDPVVEAAQPRGIEELERRVADLLVPRT